MASTVLEAEKWRSSEFNQIWVGIYLWVVEHHMWSLSAIALCARQNWPKSYRLSAAALIVRLRSNFICDALLPKSRCPPNLVGFWRPSFFGLQYCRGHSRLPIFGNRGRIIFCISGNVRVPAPCQYAHKLVDLVGEHLHQQPAMDLNDKLYYL